MVWGAGLSGCSWCVGFRPGMRRASLKWGKAFDVERTSRE